MAAKATAAATLIFKVMRVLHSRAAPRQMRHGSDVPHDLYPRRITARTQSQRRPGLEAHRLPGGRDPHFDLERIRMHCSKRMPVGLVRLVYGMRLFVDALGSAPIAALRKRRVYAVGDGGVSAIGAPSERAFACPSIRSVSDDGRRQKRHTYCRKDCFQVHSHNRLLPFMPVRDVTCTPDGRSPCQSCGNPGKPPGTRQGRSSTIIYDKRLSRSSSGE
jgi:hypothetical protein